MDKKKSPDFIGIGAMRCGTTWIADKLRIHPEIYIPENFKELHFFDQFYDNGIEWYENNFSKKNENQIAGEFTPKYLRDKKIPFLVKKHYPNVKLILSIRNPVDRAFSHYNFLKKHSKISDIFYESLFDEKYEVLKAGLYGEQISVYLNLFPKENIHFIIFDDIKQSPRKVIKELYKFLDVSTNFIPNNLKKIKNKRRDVKSKILARSIRKTKKYFRPRLRARTLMRKFGLYFFLGILNRLNDKQLQTDQTNKIDNKTKEYLIKYYKNDLIILNKFLVNKIDHWL